MAEYSIYKCIRTDKPLKRNGKYPIYLRVRVGLKDTKFPTNIDVLKEQWDTKKNEPKNKALLIQLNKKSSGVRSLYKPSIGRRTGIDVGRDQEFLFRKA